MNTSRTRLQDRIRRAAASIPLAAIGLILLLSGGSIALSQTTPATVPPVTLASDPLYAAGVRAKPTLTLALSVEYPTVGAQYRGGSDYSEQINYVGYFNPDFCYLYDAGAKQFVPKTSVTGHACAGAGFSGNFMNWATSSSIDILRYGLTGGDRIVDDLDATVLQRAVLPDGTDNTSDAPSYYNSSQYFPAKQISAKLAANAVPSALFGNKNPSAVYIANCLNQVYLGTAKTGSCDSPGDNGNLGRFLTRVSVCTDAMPEVRMVNGKARPFCTRYPSGHYKPTGDLQGYNDRVRVAAFGYLRDNSSSRYGGVLRAPMKYVGPTAYDADFNAVSGANPNAEWDATTGVFVPNPMKEATLPVSGVINYLNQFGRTGVPGTYKRYDPINELYYEALRYLQGLKPTPQATDGITDAMRDGFPVYNTLTTRSSPTQANLTTSLPIAPAFLDPQPPVGGLGTTGQYTCVRNSILTIGDIHTHYDKSLPGNTNTSNDLQVPASPSANQPDFSFWTQVVGGFETNQAIAYIDGAGIAQNTLGSPVYNGTPNSGLSKLFSDPQHANPSDNSNYFMAGAAYWANTHDIRGLVYDAKTNPLTGADSEAHQRPGMRVTTYMIDVNERGDSNSLSARRNNQFFLAAKYGGFNADGSKGGNPFVKSDGTYTTELWLRSGTEDSNPALGGDPQNYFLADKADAMLAALDQIFNKIATATGSIAGTSVTSTSVTSTNGGSVAYRSTFSAGDWGGDVYPLKITQDATGNIIFTPAISADTGGWEAKTQFQNTPKDTDTSNWPARTLFVGSDLTSDGTSAIAFKTFSDLTPTQQEQIVNKRAVAGQDLVDYLRGDHSKEAPAAEGLRPRATALGDIINSGVIYEGAPSSLITDTSYAQFLTAHRSRQAAVYAGANDGMLHGFDAATGKELFGYIPSFVVPRLNALTSTSYVHQSYVDATPAVAEANLDTTDLNKGDWRTVLVSGTGAGSQGVFALDVTDPAAFSTKSLLWEFTDKNDPDLGNVLGTPAILKFQTNAGQSSDPTYKWYAVVASGVNNYNSDGNASSTGYPALFLLDLSKAAGDSWKINVNYFKVVLPQSSTQLAMGAINIAAYAPNGVVSRIYVGDLQGDLWDLNFSGQDTSGWTFDNLVPKQKPLFMAADKDGHRQPITAAPQITGYGGNLILLFGTGKYLEPSDNTAPYAIQSIYAILDPLDGSAPPELSRSDLTPRTASGGAVSGANFTWGAKADSKTNTYAGWYFDLPSSSGTGERFISNFAVYSGTVFANSIIPSAGGCSAGTSNSYTLGVFGGGGSYSQSTVGLLGPPALIFVGNPSSGTSPDSGLPTQTVTVVPANIGSDGVGSGTKKQITQYIGVRSWRQIFSYKDISGK